jgi:hypothetical protein
VGCTVHGHAHCAVRLVNRFGIGMTVGQRDRRNYQKGQRRKESEGSASESIVDVIHAQAPIVRASTDTESMLLQLSR